MTSLQNQIILITGASSGIGTASARIFAGAGAKLILAARRLERLQELADALVKEFGTEIHLLQLDVRDRNAVESAISTLPPAWSDIDILINNAGLSRGLDKLHEA
ncbi:SDR family NAD(P)-dependent oxidoreductase, partial [Nostoc sp. UCD121]